MPHHFQRALDTVTVHQPPSQAKSCPSCCTLVFVLELDAPATCPNCREQILLRAAQAQQPSRRSNIDQDISPRHTTPPLLVSPPHSPPAVSRARPLSPTRFEPPPDFNTTHSTPLYRTDLPTPPLPLNSPSPNITHPTISTLRQPREPLLNPPISISTPDPLADVTRIRIPTRPIHCLYPGATFKGTQKSGRNSYDVTVTIVDVDFPTSFLCGYLCIRGLTDDWPELTTYFDAEIIGSRYGFLTQNWGASENEDLVHWSRFPAFRHIKHEAKRPRLTIDERDRGAVFMRWKEKFLVPDHRVHDINGASFAGFYYVCVDFNPAASASAGGAAADAADEEDHRSGRKQHRNRRGSSARRTSAVRRPPSLAPYTPPVATMSGFYYHQNSEPYQQLSLTHVPELSSSSFEFR